MIVLSLLLVPMVLMVQRRLQPKHTLTPEETALATAGPLVETETA